MNINHKHYRIHSVIICDDIRRENNNKEILIGVYSGSIVFSKPLPATLPRLVVRVEMETREPSKVSRVRICCPDDRELLSFETGVPLTLPERGHIVFAIELGNITFEKAGQYKIEFGLDHKPEEIYSFMVQGAG